jgi:threonylcarbamoyladenosine tRNA methylthiotransferase MtaB
MQERTCRFVTLGCKVNQYDTQLVREAFVQAGYREAEPGERADLCVVNTCTVTNKADSDGRYEIRKLQRQNPGTKIVVMGCYATRAPAEVLALPGVTAVIDHKDHLEDELKPFGVRHVPRGISKFEGHHRAFVKVQDGCLLNCSFCIIPQVRPSLRSRPPEEIEAEVRCLVAAGFHEIVLAGIHLGHYGVEFSKGRPQRQWCRLSHLVRRLTRIPGDWRLRLSSLEATEVTDDLIGVLADEPRVCPHLHLCLQSGSDAVLRAMKRRYRVAGFMRRIDEIRRRLDQPALTTDVIVGFPGETDEDFQETLNVCESVGFSKIHIFPYSPRRRTSAASMTMTVSAAVMRERKSRLQVLESQLAARYYRSLVGRSLQVLVERPDGGPGEQSHGTACRYVPVRFTACANDEFQLVTLKIVETRETYVVGCREHSQRTGAARGKLSLPVLDLLPTCG